jgi:hypothetical protein
MAEFCPRCTAPLETSQDADRLCQVCGWFGDQQEALRVPPRKEVYHPVLDLVQSLELYRDVCRHEQTAEQKYSAGQGTTAELRQIQNMRHQAAHSIISMFIALRGRDVKQELRRINGVVPWPADWKSRHYNGSQPCDTLVGPCSCGAWHTADEDWVRAMLFKYNAEIIDGDQA